MLVLLLLSMLKYMLVLKLAFLLHFFFVSISLQVLLNLELYLIAQSLAIIMYHQLVTLIEDQ